MADNWDFILLFVWVNERYKEGINPRKRAIFYLKLNRDHRKSPLCCLFVMHSVWFEKKIAFKISNLKKIFRKNKYFFKNHLQNLISWSSWLGLFTVEYALSLSHIAVTSLKTSPWSQNQHVYRGRCSSTFFF